MALVMTSAVGYFEFITVGGVTETFMAVEPEGCGKCTIELTYIDPTATPDAPLFERDDWVGIACDEIDASGEDLDVGSTGIMAIGQVNSYDSGSKQRLDEVFMGTYQNYINEDGNPQTDYHEYSIFADDPDVWISDNWIQFRAIAEYGMPNEWGSGNHYFTCWLYHR